MLMNVHLAELHLLLNYTLAALHNFMLLNGLLAEIHMLLNDPLTVPVT